MPDPYVAAQSAFSHGADNTQNLVTDTFYNARGLVRKQVDVLGNVTLFGYDAAGRLVKTIQFASQPTYNNDYTGTSPDPELASYSASSADDEDLITTQTYDPAGNLVQTVNALDISSFTVYDALNRPVQTVRNAKSTATVALQPGDTGYDATNDPRSASYVISTDPDRDQMDRTEYDALGRVLRSQQLLDVRPADTWITTLYGYDALGRQVNTIRNASQPTYDLAADPDLSEYVVTEDADLDIVTLTTYDASGRVLYTEDAAGVKTWLVYDGLGRQVKTVQDYVDQGEAPDAWVWDSTDQRWETSTGTAIDCGTANDQNVVGATAFDTDGRVQQTQDVLGRLTRYVYDSLGRVIRTVANYVDQGED